VPGVAHVVSRSPAPFLACGGELDVHCVPAAHDNLVWLAVCRRTGAAAIVDGPGAEEVVAYADPRGIRVTAIWNTHTHPDHVGVNRGLAALGRLDGLEVVGPRKVADEVPGLTVPVWDGDVVRLGALEARVLATEGHLRGHVSFVLGDVLFCGDTLFTGGCGRVNGTHAELWESLRRLAALPGDTRVCCAHEYTQDNLRFAWLVDRGNPALAERIRRVWRIRADGGCAVPSTITEERDTNPFLRAGSYDAFVERRTLKDRGAHKALSDGELPLAVGRGDV
jgi:hydroxyacylglutathione hydrolase